MKERKETILSLVVDILLAVCSIIAMVTMLGGIITNNMECTMYSLIVLVITEWIQIVSDYVRRKFDFKKAIKQIFRILLIVISCIMIFR